MAEFGNVFAQTMGVEEAAYRLLAVEISHIDASRPPRRIGMLTTLDFTSPRILSRQFDKLVAALERPAPVQ